MAGNELLNEMISGTGLPEDLLSKELAELLKRAQISQEACSLEDLRAILAEYAQEVLLAAKQTYSE
jgi:hypothetical protein